VTGSFHGSALMMKALTLESAPRSIVRPVAETISVLAGRVGVSTDTVRYYERLGLLPPPERTPSGYRVYDRAAAERLRFIRGAQRMGLRLADIGELLDVRDRGQCPCGHTATLIQRRLAEVNAELRELTDVRRQLLDLKRRNDECVDASGVMWSCTVVEGDEGGET
jgi:DNA-binding transcriptional MerR regulator